MEHNPRTIEDILIERLNHQSKRIEHLNHINSPKDINKLLNKGPWFRSDFSNHGGDLYLKAGEENLVIPRPLMKWVRTEGAEQYCIHVFAVDLTEIITCI